MRKLLPLLLLPFLLCGCKDSYLTTVNIYHTDGISGMYWSRQEPAYQNKEVGGFAVLKNFYAAENGKKMLFDGGDWYAQTPEGTINKGSAALNFMNMTGYNGAAVANADLGSGWTIFSDVIKNSPVNILSSNIETLSGRTPANIKKYLIREENGIKFGIFALTIKKSSAASMRLGEVKIEDEIESAKKTIEELKNKETDIIILLSDKSEGESSLTDRDIAEQLEGVDILLTSAAPGEEASIQTHNSVRVVRTVPFLTEVSKLKIKFDLDKKIMAVDFESVVLSKERYGEDEELKTQIESLRKTTGRKLNNVIATAEDDILDVDDAPSALGEFAASCLNQWAKTDIAIINSDSLRSDIKKGKITEYFLYELYPYNDTVTLVRVRGEEIKNILELSLASKNNFPQIDGMSVEYNPSAPIGSRVKDVYIKGYKPGAQIIYRMATTDHIVAGGFGHDAFINSVEFKNTQVEIRTILRLCLYKKKILNYVAPNNWKEVK